MTWPTVAINTTNTDAGTDSPAAARSDILDAQQKLNQIMAHPSALMRALLESTGVLRNYIDGCTMSTTANISANSDTISVAAGVAMDSTNSHLMILSAISKTTASWAVGSGNGGLDTGSHAATTWYHCYVIRRPDTGVVDVIFSTSATAPTLPANYTQYRRIGSARSLGANQWAGFLQKGDYFAFKRPEDVSGSPWANPGTAAVSRTVLAPLGIVTLARLVVGLRLQRLGGGGVSSCSVLVSPLSGDDETSQGTTSITATRANSQLTVVAQSGQWWISTAVVDVLTNTSSQVRTRLSASSSETDFLISSAGWTDWRGRDA